MPPAYAVALGLMGAAALVRWFFKEAQRVNAQAVAGSDPSAFGPVDRKALPTLKRDPRTGEYRPG